MKNDVIVVGGGLAGLSAAMKLAEKGLRVKIVCVTKVKRSHSVCAQGGINAAINNMGENDSPYHSRLRHDQRGRFSRQPAPHRRDVPLRPQNHLLDGPPRLHLSTALLKGISTFAALAAPFTTAPLFAAPLRGSSCSTRSMSRCAALKLKVWWKSLSTTNLCASCGMSKGITRGIVLMDHYNLKLEVLKADAVVIATGGPGLIFKKSTNSTFCTGAANGRLWRQGMKYANGEFIQIHPTAIPGEDKMRLMSESARGEGGRIWVYGDSSKQIVAPNG